MATEEEIYKLIIQFENEEKLKTVAASAALAEQRFKALYSTLGAGNAQTKAAAAALSDLNKQLAAGKSANRDLGRAALEASRGLEDLQYGVAGVLNNIPSLIQALGGPAGLAAGVSIAAVAGKVLYDHWNDLAGLFGAGKVKTQAEEMEELGKKTSKTADETARLAKYERDRAALAGQAGSQTATETHQQKGVDAAVAEAPFARFNDIVKDIVRQRATNATPGGDQLAAIAATKEQPGVAGTDKETIRAKIQEIKDAINANVEKFADQMKLDIRNNPEALKGFIEQLKVRGVPKKVIDRFEEAAKSPEEADADQQNRKFDAQSIKNQAARRQAAIKAGADASQELSEGDFTEADVKEFQEAVKGVGDLEEIAKRFRAFKRDKAADKFYEKQDADIDSKRATFLEESRKADVARSSAGLQEQFTPEILGNVARGKGNDQGALAAKVSQALQLGGKSKEDADSMSDQIAAELLDKVEGRIRERAGQEGLTREGAAEGELAEEAASRRARAPKPHGSIAAGPAEFAHNLQMSLFNKADPVQAAIKTAVEKLAATAEKQYAATVAAKKGSGIPVAFALAAGPA